MDNFEIHNLAALIRGARLADDKRERATVTSLLYLADETIGRMLNESESIQDADSAA